MASYLTHIFAVLLVVNAAFGLTCYNCDSSTNSLCNYGLFSISYNTMDCNEQSGGSALTNWIPKQCVKLVATDKDNKEYIARGCMPHLGGACTAVAKTLSFFSSIEGNINDINCFPCDGDKCNSSPKRYYGRFTLFGFVLASLAFML